MKLKKIGIIGCGAIGTEIAEYVEKHLKDKASIVAICDINSQKAKELSMKIKPAPLITTIDELINKSNLIVEAASSEI